MPFPRLALLWETLRSSFWFVPGLMAAGSVGVALGAVAVDRTVLVGEATGRFWLYTGGAEGGREVLATVASSMIGVAGVAFSITIVALSLAAQQLGPRLLRNFMRDPGNQVVLGTFIATFLYCILVLRTVRGLDDRQFVPHLAITIGVLLGIVSLGVLIYFIHHVAMLIQAPSLMAAVAADLDAAIVRLFPERIGHGAERAADGCPTLPREEAAPVAAPHDGYVQSVDADGLLAIASEHDAIVRLVGRPGQFVTRGSPLAQLWPAAAATGEVRKAIAGSFVLGAYRTPTQDAEFAVNQLVEVALRALSPSVNDPFTAITAVDRLSGALSRLAERDLPPAARYDDDGTLRVVAEPLTHAEMTEAAFDQIRQAARDNVAVTLRLLDAIADVAPRASDGAFRAALHRQAVMVARGSRAAVPEPCDRREVERRYLAALRALAADGQPGPPAA